MKRTLNTGIISAIVLLLCCLMSTTVYAQTVSRVGFTVNDEAGNPLKDVKITASHPPTGMSMERTTNKKGKATFAFRDGSLTYEISLALEGFDPATTSVKPVTGSVSYHTYTLYKTRSGQAVPSGGGTREIPLTPAQETFNEGVTALKEDAIDTAKEKFLAALEMDPELYQAHSALAAIYLEEKDYQNAKASSEVLIEREPGSGRGYRMLYEALSGLGEQEAADELLGKITELESSADAVPLIFNEGADALRMGDIPRARERLEKAHSLDPELIQAVKLLALVYINDKEYQKAAEYAERYLATNDDLTMKKVRMDAYRAMGDTAKAEEAFQAVADADPVVMVESLYKGGLKDFNAGNTEAAVGSFEQILKIDADHANTHYLLGLCYVNMGKNSEAKTHFERLLALQPDHENAGTAKEMLSFLQ